MLLTFLLNPYFIVQYPTAKIEKTINEIKLKSKLMLELNPIAFKNNTNPADKIKAITTGFTPSKNDWKYLFLGLLQLTKL